MIPNKTPFKKHLYLFYISGLILSLNLYVRDRITFSTHQGKLNGKGDVGRVLEMTVWLFFFF